jgi:hypothetical protein
VRRALVVGGADRGEELRAGVDGHGAASTQRVLGDQHRQRGLAGAARALEPEALAGVELLADSVAELVQVPAEVGVHRGEDVLDRAALERHVAEALRDLVQQAARARERDPLLAAGARARDVLVVVEHVAGAVAEAVRAGVIGPPATGHVGVEVEDFVHARLVNQQRETVREAAGGNSGKCVVVRSA